MIKVENLRFKYKDEQLYNDLNIRILNNEHIVLLGPNGSGKSTFLKLLYKDLIPDSGKVIYERDIKVGYLDQYMNLNENLLVSEYLYDLFKHLFDKENLMNSYYEKIASNNLNQNDIDKYLNYAASLQEELINNDFYNIKPIISNVINGLGLSNDVLNKKIKHLSSGMRSKVILAKILLEENDIILLDEPTNFLDEIHIKWLETFLKQYNKAFIVVSHNEEFLRNISEVIFDLDNKEINRYKLSYDEFLKEKEIRNINYDKKYIKQQNMIKQTKMFIDKNINRSSTSKRAKSRRKMLSKINVIEKRKEKQTYTFEFPFYKRSGRDVLKVNNLTIGYDYPLIEPLSFDIMYGDKVCITGKNGIGKTTLIETLLNNINKISGSFKWGENIKYNYLKQDDFYKTEMSAYEVFNREYYNLEQTDIYNILSSYGIDYNMANRPINTLSGGEQIKAKLALMKNTKTNLLILDEPTNHLDFNAKEALKEALIKYEGTLILISHESDFYEEVCDYEIMLY